VCITPSQTRCCHDIQSIDVIAALLRGAPPGGGGSRSLPRTDAAWAAVAVHPVAARLRRHLRPRRTTGAGAAASEQARQPREHLPHREPGRRSCTPCGDGPVLTMPDGGRGTRAGAGNHVHAGGELAGNYARAGGTGNHTCTRAGGAGRQLRTRGRGAGRQLHTARAGSWQATTCTRARSWQTTTHTRAGSWQATTYARTACLVRPL
jgi:hypothetical protein